MRPALAEVRSARGRRVFIHPGMVRTATSTLQRHVFARHRGLCYLGIPAPSPALDWAVAHICQADSIYLQADRLHDVLEAAVAAADRGQAILISYENFAFCKSKDKGLIAQRLAALFPEARILFTIRRQEDLVRSRYLTDLRKLIKLRSFVEFDDWYWFGFREAYRHIFDDLHYGEIIGCYAELFGRDRVSVHLFEELRADAGTYAARLAATLGVDAGEFASLLADKQDNAAMTEAYFRFWRRFGHLLPRRLVRKLARRTDRRPGRPARIELPPKVRNHLAGLYAGSNARLSELLGIDLARYGYSLPGPAAAASPTSWPPGPASGESTDEA